MVQSVLIRPGSGPNGICLRVATLALASYFTLATWSQEIPIVTQEFQLRPGWNSVFLEVEPEINRIEGILAGLPVQSVWTRAERLTSTDFIQDQNEVAWNEPGWLVYLPENRPDAFLTSLHSVQVNRPYLIQISGNASVIWRVTGRPSLRHPDWAPNTFNLRGFPIDPVRPPTFRDYFKGAPAHYRADTQALEEVYRLDSAGEWRLVSANDAMASGEAYWVYSRGASDFISPLKLAIEQGDGLDFGYLVAEFSVRFTNQTDDSRTAFISPVQPESPARLARRVLQPATGEISWAPLAALHSLPLPSRTEQILRLAIRRQTFATADYGNVLAITDGAGSRIWVPVSAQRSSAGVASNLQATSHAGIWLGAARVSAVSEVHASNPNQPTRTRSEFPIRLLLHVDGQGQVRLLKEVIQMWEDGTYRRNNEGELEPDEPGRHVWLTDPQLLSQFQGSTLRGGVPVGRRISTVGIDFEGGPNHALDLNGQFGIGESVTASIVLPPDFKTNPFRHRYHPDHDNLDARLSEFQAEAYRVERQLTLEFTANDPSGFTSADYGYGVMGGHYRETISGLHHRAIQIQGQFRLQRIADTPELNPSPRFN